MRLHLMTALLFIAPYAGVAAAQDTTQSRQPQDTTMRQPTEMQQSDDQRNGPQSDEAILRKMHDTNQLEVRLGQLAQRNGSSKVKSYAARLVRDHQTSDQRVTALAKQLNVTLDRGHWLDSSGKFDRQGRSGQNQRGDSAFQRDTTRFQRDTTQRNDTTQNQYNRPSDTTRNQDPYNRNQGFPQSQGMQQGADTSDRAEMRQLVQRLSTLKGAQFDTEFANAMVQGHEKAIAMLEQAQNTAQNQQVRSLIASTLPTLRQHRDQAQQLITGATSTSSSQQ